MVRKIVCIFCKEMADIVSQSDNELVVCQNCNNETVLEIYKKVLDDWFEEGRKKGISRDRRSGIDRRVADDNILIGTDSRAYRDRRKK
jgi:hypothetical protein